MQNINPGTAVGTPSPTPPGASSPTAVIRLTRPDHTVLQFPADQNCAQLLERELAKRKVYAFSTDAARRVPELESLCQLLCDLDRHAPLAMGIALGVSSDFLVQKFGFYERDPVKLVKSLLAASLPLSLADVAARLEKNAGFGGEDIAQQIRSLAACRAIERLDALDLSLCDALVSVFLPLIAHIDWLGEVLGVPEAQVFELQFDTVPPSRFQLTKTIIEQDTLVRRAQNKPARTCGEWMEVMAMAGVDVEELEHLARRWQLRPPPGSLNWYGYQRDRVMAMEDELMLWHQLDHSHPVSLQQVVTFLRHSAFSWSCNNLSGWYRIAFPLAVGNASNPRLFSQREWRDLCLFSLLRHSVSQGGDGQHISERLLCRLVRLNLGHSSVNRLLQCTPPLEETQSRVLCPFDVLRLSQAGDEPERHALEMAAALGVGGEVVGNRIWHWSAVWNESGPCTRWQALCTWQWTGTRAPWLETGHLVSLFRRFGREDLMRQLTGSAGSDCAFGEPASPFPDRVVEFMDLAQDLCNQPGLVRAFGLQNGVKEHFGYAMLPGSRPNWRLLNCLAVDPLMLQAWRSFVEAFQKSRESAAAKELEMNAGGYPHDYVCPITLIYMDDPVLIIESQNSWSYFSRRSLIQALRDAGPFNPLTRSPLYPQDVPEVDQEHLQRITAWRERHPELEDAQLEDAQEGQQVHEEQDPGEFPPWPRRNLCRLL